MCQIMPDHRVCWDQSFVSGGWQMDPGKTKAKKERQRKGSTKADGEKPLTAREGLAVLPACSSSFSSPLLLLFVSSPLLLLGQSPGLDEPAARALDAILVSTFQNGTLASVAVDLRF